MQIFSANEVIFIMIYVSYLDVKKYGKSPFLARTVPRIQFVFIVYKFAIRNSITTPTNIIKFPVRRLKQTIHSNLWNVFSYQMLQL